MPNRSGEKPNGRISRRDLIRMGLLSSAYTFAWNQREALGRSMKRSGKMYCVVVVGAGAAGLDPTRELHSEGLKVTVIEGRDRIGGRI